MIIRVAGSIGEIVSIAEVESKGRVGVFVREQDILDAFPLSCLLAYTVEDPSCSISPQLETEFIQEGSSMMQTTKRNNGSAYTMNSPTRPLGPNSAVSGVSVRDSSRDIPTIGSIDDSIDSSHQISVGNYDYIYRDPPLTYGSKGSPRQLGKTLLGKYLPVSQRVPIRRRPQSAKQTSSVRPKSASFRESAISYSWLNPVKQTVENFDETNLISPTKRATEAPPVPPTPPAVDRRSRQYKAAPTPSDGPSGREVEPPGQSSHHFDLSALEGPPISASTSKRVRPTSASATTRATTTVIREHPAVSRAYTPANEQGDQLLSTRPKSAQRSPNKSRPLVSTGLRLSTASALRDSLVGDVNNGTAISAATKSEVMAIENEISRKEKVLLRRLRKMGVELPDSAM